MPRARELGARYWLAIPALVVVALLSLRACITTDPLDNMRVVPSDPRDPPGTIAREGSLYIARGGPVVIGYHNSMEALLTALGRSRAVDARSGVEAELRRLRLDLPGGSISHGGWALVSERDADAQRGDAHHVWSRQYA